MVEIREKLLDWTREVDEQLAAHAQQVHELFEEILKEPDITQAMQATLPAVDEFFLQELIDEIELGESEYVEEGRGADKGLMEGADVLITGAVTGFEPEASGGGGALGGLKKKAFGKVGLESKTATILIDLKLIDIRTRRVIKAMSLEGKSSSWAADVAGGGERVAHAAILRRG